VTPAGGPVSTVTATCGVLLTAHVISQSRLLVPADIGQAMEPPGATTDLDLCFSGHEGWPLERTFRRQRAQGGQCLERRIECMRVAAWTIAAFKQLWAGEWGAAVLSTVAALSSVALLALSHLSHAHTR
jgi:hypothetical protein